MSEKKTMPPIRETSIVLDEKNIIRLTTPILEKESFRKMERGILDSVQGNPIEEVILAFYSFLYANAFRNVPIVNKEAFDEAHSYLINKVQACLNMKESIALAEIIMIRVVSIILALNELDHLVEDDALKPN